MKAMASAPIFSTVCGTDDPLAADTAVVEGDHAMVRGDAVDDPRIPVVEDRGEVVQEDHRHVGAGTELAVGERRRRPTSTVRVGTSFQVVTSSLSGRRASVQVNWGFVLYSGMGVRGRQVGRGRRGSGGP